jgi:O-antigen/teichoic acid export membrane protein
VSIVSASLAQRAGSALTWKAAQLAGTKGIFLVRTLVLARLLSPDDFGLLAIATVAVGVLMSVTDLGMTPALVHQPGLEEAHYNSAWTVNVTRALLVSGALIVAAPAISALFAEPRAADILRFLALKPLIDSGASIKVAELVRHLNYRRLACVTLPAVAVETIIAILLAMRFGVWALVAGALTGALAGVVASYLLAPHRPRVVLTSATIRPLIRYGRWIFLTGVVAVSASALTQVVIARQLGAVELGLYFLAARLAFFPYEVVSQVVGDVAFPLYARIQDDRTRVARAFRSHLVGVAAFLLPVYVLLISFAPWLVQDVLGQRWLGTELVIQLLACVGIAGLFGDTTGPLFRGLGHPGWILAIEVIQSTLVILLLWSLTGRYGVVGAALAWLIAIASSQVVSFIFARRILQRPLAGSIVPMAVVLLASLAAALTVFVLRQVVSGVAGLLMAVAFAASAAAIMLWSCDRRFDLGLRTDVTQAFPQMADLIAFATATRR